MRLFFVAAWLALLPQPAWPADPIEIQPLPEAGKDTAVYRFQPDNERDPDNPALYTFTLDDPATGHHDWRSFFQFDLPEELDGICIQKAEIWVYFGFTFVYPGTSGGSDEPAIVECRPVLAAWNETGMSWNDQPPIGEPLDTVENITTFDYVICDITPLAQAWIDGAPNYGVALSSPTGRVLGIYSFEATSQIAEFRPALFVTPADEPTACPEPAASGSVAVVVLASLAARRSA